MKVENIFWQNDFSNKICRITLRVISIVYLIVCKFDHDIRTIASRKQIPSRDFPQILLPASLRMHHDFKPSYGSQNSDTNHSIFAAILNTRQAPFYGTFPESWVLFCFTFIPLIFLINLGPVVRKPINANPRLKVNPGFHLTREKWVWRLMSSLKSVKKSRSQYWRTKMFWKNLYWLVIKLEPKFTLIQD